MVLYREIDDPPFNWCAACNNGDLIKSGIEGKQRPKWNEEIRFACVSRGAAKQQQGEQWAVTKANRPTGSTRKEKVVAAMIKDSAFRN